MASNESKVPNLTSMILQATERIKKTQSFSGLEEEQCDNSTLTSTCKPEPEATQEKYVTSETSTQSIKAATTTEFDDIKRASDLVGNRAFKDLCHEIESRAGVIRRNSTQRFFFSTAYLFAVNAGSGYKTSLCLLEHIMEKTGLFPTTSSRSEYVLPSPSDNDVTLKINNIIGTLEYAFSSPRIVTFDISSWLGHTGEQDFKALLMYIFQNNTQCLVVFRIPFVREKLLMETNSDLSDVISTRNVVFDPFSKEELRTIAGRMLSPYDVKLSPDAMEDFDKRIEQEKSNGYFYGIHTVKKVVGDFIREMELQSNDDNYSSRVITSSVIDRASSHIIPKNEEPGFEGFSGLIGIESVEAKLREILYQIQFARQQGIGRPCMHMFFVGNPGTGKTTVARMLGNELKKQGVLRIGKFFEHKGRDLCGEYVGQTAPKTIRICEQAYGSILFIDEAYSLASSNAANDYGKEAVDTLIAEMENHYDDLVVIFAGYPDEMQSLLALNPGMRSRVPYTLEFLSYSRRDLYRIFEKMASEHFEHSPGFDNHAAEFFMSIPDDIIQNRSFGNARFVRNLYERVWGKATIRCARSNNANIELTIEDFDAAAREFMAQINAQ